MFETEIKDVQWMGNYAKIEKYGGIFGYNTTGVMKLANGMVGSLHLGASVTPSASTSRLEIYGDNTNVIHAIWVDKILLYSSEQKPKEWNLGVKGTRVWGHRQIDEHFVDCILHNKLLTVTVEAQ